MPLCAGGPSKVTQGTRGGRGFPPPPHCRLELRDRQGVLSEPGTAVSLTQAVVSIMGQHEAVKAGAPVVPWDVDALVHAAPVVVVILTLVDVCKTRAGRAFRERAGGSPLPAITEATRV